MSVRRIVARERGGDFGNEVMVRGGMGGARGTWEGRIVGGAEERKGAVRVRRGGASLADVWMVGGVGHHRGRSGRVQRGVL
jgi:hypothetical protein